MFAAYYLSRSSFLRRLGPKTLVIDIPAWGKIAIRPNEVDLLLLQQIFIDKAYRAPGGEMRRIMDLGANIGAATLYLSRIFPEAEFACVEPSPQNIPILKQTIALNGIRARVFEAAIGPVDGTISLFLSARPDCSSVVNAIDSEGVVQVPQVSVPHVMREMLWDDIDVLKLDIEGAERSLFTENSGWLAKVRTVLGESHVNVGYPYAQLEHDLNGYGFVLETFIEECESYGATFYATKSPALVAPV